MSEGTFFREMESLKLKASLQVLYKKTTGVPLEMLVTVPQPPAHVLQHSPGCESHHIVSPTDRLTDEDLTS